MAVIRRVGLRLTHVCVCHVYSLEDLELLGDQHGRQIPVSRKQCRMSSNTSHTGVNPMCNSLRVCHLSQGLLGGHLLQVDPAQWRYVKCLTATYMFPLHTLYRPLPLPLPLVFASINAPFHQGSLLGHQFHWCPIKTN